jgi:hypothetical protein
MAQKSEASCNAKPTPGELAAIVLDEQHDTVLLLKW